MEYDCPCGKKHRSRNTVWKHKKRAAEKDVLENVRKDVLKDEDKDKKGRPPGQGQLYIKEIDLQEEFRTMGKTLNPKNEEDENTCGKCGGKIRGEPKYCPHCGVEFG